MIPGLGSPLDIVSALVGAGAQIATPIVASASARPAAEVQREQALVAQASAAQGRERRNLLMVAGVGLGALALAVWLLRRRD